MPVTTIAFYDFHPATETEGTKILEVMARVLKDAGGARTVFVGAALDTPHRHAVVATYSDGNAARSAEDSYRKQAAAGGSWDRLVGMCARPPVFHRIIHD